VPQITRVRDDEGACIRDFPRAHRLEGAPHVVFESQRGQLAGGSHRGRASAPSVPSERDRAPPSKPAQVLLWRVSGPRAYPYRMGPGRPLEPPASSSTRNPQSTTQSMGVVETSPSVSRRDGEGAFRARRRARPDRLEWAQAQRLDARLRLLGCTECERYQSRARDRSRLKHRRCQLKQTPRPLVKIREKTPAGALTLLQGFGG
jgi:hypothetical protein